MATEPQEHAQREGERRPEVGTPAPLAEHLRSDDHLRQQDQAEQEEARARTPSGRSQPSASLVASAGPRRDRARSRSAKNRPTSDHEQRRLDEEVVEALAVRGRGTRCRYGCAIAHTTPAERSSAARSTRSRACAAAGATFAAAPLPARAGRRIPCSFRLLRSTVRRASKSARSWHRSATGGRRSAALRRITSPYASSSRNHASLRVGNDGTACQRSSSGTSPTTAIVAAWSASATSGPVIVAPDHDPPCARRRRAATCRRRPGRRTSRRRCLPYRRRHGAPPGPRAAQPPRVKPTAPTWGSVKMTRGDRAPSTRRRASRPRIVSATSRPWYLPMCVSSTRPLTSPTANSQSWPGTRSVSSTRR